MKNNKKEKVPSTVIWSSKSERDEIDGAIKVEIKANKPGATLSRSSYILTAALEKARKLNQGDKIMTTRIYTLKKIEDKENGRHFTFNESDYSVVISRLSTYKSDGHGNYRNVETGEFKSIEKDADLLKQIDESNWLFDNNPEFKAEYSQDLKEWEIPPKIKFAVGKE